MRLIRKNERYEIRSSTDVGVTRMYDSYNPAAENSSNASIVCANVNKHVIPCMICQDSNHNLNSCI